MNGTSAGTCVSRGNRKQTFWFDHAGMTQTLKHYLAKSREKTIIKP
ncbi:MAG: hypothetical protein KF851_03055 [Pirellulaceae bacterium]|jgi:hypothetical protein|nr:hypothetical protein [Pirellulaceae bacterium]